MSKHLTVAICKESTRYIGTIHLLRSQKGVRNVSFSENFANVINEWSLMRGSIVYPLWNVITGIIGHILRNKQTNKCVCIHEIIRLIIMKRKMKMTNRSHRYNINRPRSRYGHKYSKCKKCLSMMIVICIKQHLSNIWISVHEKVKQHWGWVEKRRYL